MPKTPQNHPFSHVIAGIDPSLTHTAIAVGPVDPGSGPRLTAVTSEPTSRILADRMRRYRRIARGVLGAIGSAPALVLIEAYAFSARGRATLDLAENGAILRAALMVRGHVVIEVSPGALKSFATGSGRASKEEMVAAMAEVSGLALRSSHHNEADALALLWLGSTIARRPIWPVSEGQQAIADRTLKASKIIDKVC